LIPMKSHLKKILSCILAAVPLLVMAQAPGYQGKKLVVYYNNYFSPALLRPNPSGETGLFKLNARHSLSADYATSRRGALGLSMQFYRTMATFEDYSMSYSDPYYGGYGFYQPEGHADISGTNIGIYFKSFFKSYIAPHGKYMKAGLMYHGIKAKYDEDDFALKEFDYNQNREVVLYTPTLGTGKNSYSAISMSWGAGKQRIYFDKLVMDMGAELGWVFGANNILDGQYTTSNTAVIEKGSKKRVGGMHLLNFTLGLGYLAY
jgi:hypothetical protein